MRALSHNLSDLSQTPIPTYVHASSCYSKEVYSHRSAIPLCLSILSSVLLANVCDGCHEQQQASSPLQLAPLVGAGLNAYPHMQEPSLLGLRVCLGTPNQGLPLQLHTVSSSLILSMIIHLSLPHSCFYYLHPPKHTLSPSISPCSPSASSAGGNSYRELKAGSSGVRV